MSIVVHGIDHGSNQRRFHADPGHVFNSLHLDIEQVLHAAMLVLFVACAVELQIRAVESRLREPDG